MSAPGDPLFVQPDLAKMLGHPPAPPPAAPPAAAPLPSPQPPDPAPAPRPVAARRLDNLIPWGLLVTVLAGGYFAASTVYHRTRAADAAPELVLPQGPAGYFVEFDVGGNCEEVVWRNDNGGSLGLKLTDRGRHVFVAGRDGAYKFQCYGLKAGKGTPIYDLVVTLGAGDPKPVPPAPVPPKPPEPAPVPTPPAPKPPEPPQPPPKPAVTPDAKVVQDLKAALEKDAAEGKADAAAKKHLLGYAVVYGDAAELLEAGDIAKRAKTWGELYSQLYAAARAKGIPLLPYLTRTRTAMAAAIGGYDDEEKLEGPTLVKILSAMKTLAASLQEVAK